MKSIPQIFKYFLFLLFPILLVYPNKLFQDLYINYIYIIFCAIITLIVNNKVIKINFLVSFFFILFILVLIANIFSSTLLFSIQSSDYIGSTLRYFCYFLIIYILSSTTKNISDFVFWGQSFLFAFILSLIIIILDNFRVPFIEQIFKINSFESLQTSEVNFRAYGSYLSPISAGIFLLNTFVILFTYTIYNNLSLKLKYFFYTILGVTLVCIFATASRTALGGLLFFFTIIILTSKSKIKIISGIVILSLFLYYTGIVDVYIENILLRNERETTNSSNILEGSGRFDTFVNSIKLFFDYRTFLFGVGPSEYSKGDGIFSLAHNGYLSLVLCHGLIGFAVFCRLLIKLSKRVKKFKIIYRMFVFYSLVNAITFISSDGPVTHFWIVNFIFTIYLIYFGGIKENILLKNNNLRISN